KEEDVKYLRQLVFNSFRLEEVLRAIKLFPAYLQLLDRKLFDVEAIIKESELSNLAEAKKLTTNILENTNRLLSE
ncbi:MAG: hypothetical protein AAFV80_04320, partial [Bacteroidota bacterium]